MGYEKDPRVPPVWENHWSFQKFREEVTYWELAEAGSRSQKGQCAQLIRNIRPASDPLLDRCKLWLTNNQASAVQEARPARPANPGTPMIPEVPERLDADGNVEQAHIPRQEAVLPQAAQPAVQSGVQVFMQWLAGESDVVDSAKKFELIKSWRTIRQRSGETQLQFVERFNALKTRMLAARVSIANCEETMALVFITSLETTKDGMDTILAMDKETLPDGTTEEFPRVATIVKEMKKTQGPTSALRNTRSAMMCFDDDYYQDDSYDEDPAWYEGYYTGT